MGIFVIRAAMCRRAKKGAARRRPTLVVTLGGVRWQQTHEVTTGLDLGLADAPGGGRLLWERHGCGGWPQPRQDSERGNSGGRHCLGCQLGGEQRRK